MTDPVDPPDPDLDDLSDDELAELDEKAANVAHVLARWYDERCCCRHHMVGTFLDLLAAEGYRVEPIVVPDIVLPVKE